MEFFKNVILFFDTSMPTPPAYGIFHIASWLLAILVGILFCITDKYGSENRARRIVFITAILVILFEIYKQITYTFSYENGVITAAYQWHAFPWQFCSTPMYVGFLAGVIKKGKLHDSLMLYLATYALVAGLFVMLYPNNVFCETAGINIQTMVCHGSMIAVAIYLLAKEKVKTDAKTFLGTLAIFAATLGVAMLFNEGAHLIGITENYYFNMYYISPYEEPFVAFLAPLQKAVPSIFWPFIYFAAFSLLAVLVLLASKWLKSLIRKKTCKA